MKVVIGATLSSPTLACAPIAEKNKVILLSPSAQSPKISQAGDYIFRIFPTNADEGKHLAALAESQGVQSAAILYLNNDYGLGLREVIHQLLSEKRITVVAEDRYDADTKDFRTQLAKLKDSTPQGVFLLGYPTDMGIVLVQMKELGVKAKVFAPNSFEAEEIINVVKGAADGVMYIYPTVPDTEAATRVKEQFRDMYGSEMNIYNAMGYDAVKLLASAIEQAMKSDGSINTSSVKNFLYQMKSFPGATGPITFDENGDTLDRPMEVRVVENGRSHLWK